MSVAGLKKQFHKASQLLKEKISGVEGTKLDEDFIKMEKKTKTTNKLIVELITKTTEYLQPNPAYRAKFSLHKNMPWIWENAHPVAYPQTEGILGECMVIYGAKLGVESVFGSALVDTGKSLKQVAKVRDCMDARVRRSFIEPLQLLHEKELKEIAYHLKKLEGRRLDLDYKKRSKRITEAELQKALDKFEESKELSKRSMFNLLENEMDQVHQLLGLTESLTYYHQQSQEILEKLRCRLQTRINEASNKSKRKFKSKSQGSTMCCMDTLGFPANTLNDTGIGEELSEKGSCSYLVDQPCCRALFEFVPENQQELCFRKGDIIVLTNQVDENWYEGLFNGKSGFFPVNYVEVLVPLPQ